jgi:hypothetical protein
LKDENNRIVHCHCLITFAPQKIYVMGLIAVEGMQFYAHHGYYKEEQMLGGKLHRRYLPKNRF